MLNKIIMKNVFSIKESVVELTKGRFNYKKQWIIGEKNLCPVAVFGINGSGKTSFFKGLKFIVSSLNEGDTFLLEGNYVLEQKARVQNENIPYLISSIELFFNIDNQYYNYLVEVISGKIYKEVLYLNGKEILRRDNEYYQTKLNYTAIHKVKTLNKSILYEVKDLYLDVYDYLSNIIYIDSKRTNSIAKVLLEDDIYRFLGKYSNDVYEVLKSSKGSVLYKIEENNKHYFVNINDNVMPIEYISQGMFNASLIISLILACPKYGLVLVDDLDKYMHPFLFSYLLKLANEREVELVFSANNTHVMSLMRPDQIYIVTYNNYYSEMYRLSSIDYSIREISNIEKLYLELQLEK